LVVAYVRYLPRYLDLLSMQESQSFQEKIIVIDKGKLIVA